MWVPFLEKAWAKVNGNYDKIIAGWMSEGMTFLHGAPSISYSISGTWANNTDTAWNTLKDADVKNYVITIATNGATNPCKLVPGHAYSLLSTHEYTDPATGVLY